MSTAKWLRRLEKSGAQIGSKVESVRKSVVTLPSPSLNWAIGGGIPEGKVCLFAGPESTAKSMLCMLTFIEIQKKHPEGMCIWVDAEFSFSIDRFRELGGDVERLIVKQTNDPLEIFDWFYNDIAEMCEEGFPLKGFCIDSVNSVAYPYDIKEKSTKIVFAGAASKYLGPTLKRVVPVLHKYEITCLLISQVGVQLDQYKAMSNPWVIPAGKALAHACDLQIMLDKIETKAGKLVKTKSAIHGGDLQIGHTVRAKIQKNRTGAPARVAEFQIDYNKGVVNKSLEIYKLGVALKVIAKVPGSIKWQFGEYIATGKDNFMQLVIDTPELQDQIMEAVYKISDNDMEASDFVELPLSDDILEAAQSAMNDTDDIAAMALPDGF